MLINRIIWGAIVEREGMFTLFGKECLIEEALIYLGDGFLMTSVMFLSVSMSM